MSIDRIDHPWGESGALDTTLTDAKRDVGWVAGNSPDQPTIERFNTLQNEVDNNINQMLYRGPKRPPSGTGAGNTLSGIYDESTSALDSASQVDTGKTTPDFVDLAYAIIGGVEKILICDDDQTLGIDIIDKSTMTFDGTQSISASTLPTPVTSWHPVGITTDEASAYVLWSDDGDDHCLQAYNLSTWTTKVGWPATGTVIFDGAGTDKRVSVIHANDTLLAIPDPVTEVTASTDPALQLIDKDSGTLSAYGAGDYTSGFISQKICSNGTYIFTADGNSISIATPSSGCGGSNWPRSVSDTVDIACIGGLVLITCSSTNVLYVLHVDNANLGTCTSADSSICTNLYQITTDGLFFWANGRKLASSTTVTCSFKIDPYGIVGKNSTTVEVVGAEILTPISTINADASTQDVDNTPIIYDGESLWTCFNRVNDSVIRRIPRSNLR